MDYRCPHCRKLLFRALQVLGLEIKCPRCGKAARFGAQPVERRLSVAEAARG